MKPKYVVYECENCKNEFYRNVIEVIEDDANHCEVLVEVLKDAEGELEEFPMCSCVGGPEDHVLGTGDIQGEDE